MPGRLLYADTDNLHATAILHAESSRSRVCELRGADHDVGLSVRENAAATAAGLYTVANNDNNAKIVHGSELSRDGE